MAIPWKILIPIGMGLGALMVASRSDAATEGPLLDRREEAFLGSEAASHTRLRSNKPYALVLHQMGFSRGNEPEDYDGVTAHYKILPDGTLIWSWDDNVRLPASSGFNSGSWAVEFVGNFPSRARSQDPAHYWRPETHGMDSVTPQQIATGRYLVELLKGRGLTHILAHRQGGRNREIDPGPDVWREVAKWAVLQHGLDWGGEGFAVNEGKPIPDHWWGTNGAPRDH